MTDYDKRTAFIKWALFAPPVEVLETALRAGARPYAVSPPLKNIQEKDNG